MSELTIVIRDKTITLKQIVLPSGKIRPQITIPKDKILFWIRAYMPMQSPSGAYVSDDIADRGGKLQLLDTTVEEAIVLTTEELDALDEGY